MYPNCGFLYEFLSCDQLKNSYKKIFRIILSCKTNNIKNPY